MAPEDVFPEVLKRLLGEVSNSLHRIVPVSGRERRSKFINFEGGGVEQQFNRHLLLHHCANYAAALSIFISEKSGRRILELGCGSGLLSSAFARLLPEGYSLLATDYSSQMIEYARSIWQKQSGSALRFECLNARDISANLLKEFDGVMFLEVLEHLLPEDATSLLYRLHHGLKPGGIVVISTLDRSPFKRPFSGYIHHRVEYSYEKLRDFLSSHENNPFATFQVYRLVSPEITKKAVHSENWGGYLFNRLVGILEMMSRRNSGLEVTKKRVANLFYRFFNPLSSKMGSYPLSCLEDIQFVTTEPESYNQNSFSLIAVLKKATE